LLEIGAGAGWQAQSLKNRGYDVTAIDLPSSRYLKDRVWPITEYDGRHIPFKDNAFDIVFSSNVLEHIPHVYEFQKEIQRVVKPEGRVVHVVPSSSWRFWTNIAHLLKCWTIPNRHGEHAGDALMETYYFGTRWWMRLFRATGWEIVCQDSNGLFYTGHSVMDSRLGIGVRCRLSRILGSSCEIFVLRKRRCSW
jgi:SAM-dependent methyltransferase